jgi:lincosamide nucleotidyltransferase A/C/D/E
MGFKNTKQPVLYAFCGLPGSGKTTAAKELEKATGAVRLNVDEWVAALGMDFWDDEFRHKLDVRLYEHGLTLLKRGQSIILEDNFWTRDERTGHREVARKLGAAIELHYFDVPFDELWRRLQIRNATKAHGTVPITEELLKECWLKFQRPEEAELALFTQAVVHRPKEGQPTEMKAKEVVELCKLFEQNNVEVWVDGGWSVDALLGKQTRPHGDLDIAIHHSDVPKLRALLKARGYENVPRDDTRDCNFVLGDDQGHQIDVHSFELDENGHNTFGVAYEAVHFGGEGMINGHNVQCINPKTLVEFHTGYPLDEDDHHDVLALCEKFGIELPEDHKHWDER